MRAAEPLGLARLKAAAPRDGLRVAMVRSRLLRGHQRGQYNRVMARSLVPERALEPAPIAQQPRVVWPPPDYAGIECS